MKVSVAFGTALVFGGNDPTALNSDVANLLRFSLIRPAFMQALLEPRILASHLIIGRKSDQERVEVLELLDGSDRVPITSEARFGCCSVRASKALCGHGRADFGFGCALSF